LIDNAQRLQGARNLGDVAGIALDLAGAPPQLANALPTSGLGGGNLNLNGLVNELLG